MHPYIHASSYIHIGLCTYTLVQRENQLSHKKIKYKVTVYIYVVNIRNIKKKNTVESFDFGVEWTATGVSFKLNAQNNYICIASLNCNVLYFH